MTGAQSSFESRADFSKGVALMRNSTMGTIRALEEGSDMFDLVEAFKRCLWQV